MADRGDSRWRSVVLLAALALVLGPLLGGCVTETKTLPQQAGTVTKKPHGKAQAGKQRPTKTSSRGGGRSGERPNELEDPCATRLHELSGLLLTYYAVNKHLPDRLDELAPLIDADATFETTCPASGQPYVYVPSGLQSSSGGERYLILYDAVAAHGGLRWGIFVAPPHGGQPPATWVILMSDDVFRGYAGGK
jgi:hypothetical protein